MNRFDVKHFNPSNKIFVYLSDNYDDRYIAMELNRENQIDKFYFSEEEALDVIDAFKDVIRAKSQKDIEDKLDDE